MLLAIQSLDVEKQLALLPTYIVAEIGWHLIIQNENMVKNELYGRKTDFRLVCQPNKMVS